MRRQNIGEKESLFGERDPRVRDERARRVAEAEASRAAAAYVAELSRDLSAIARRSGLDALGFILEMAELEARQSAGRSFDP